MHCAYAFSILIVPLSAFVYINSCQLVPLLTQPLHLLPNFEPCQLNNTFCLLDNFKLSICTGLTSLHCYPLANPTNKQSICYNSTSIYLPVKSNLFKSAYCLNQF